MPWSSQAVIAQLVIIEGPDDGLFVYNGTPALGNLIASIASMAGTDEFGNLYQAGITSYGTPSSTTFTQLLSGEINFQAPGSAVGGFINGLTAGQLNLNTGDASISDNLMQLVLLSAASATGGPQAFIGPGTGPNLDLIFPSGSATTDTANLASALSNGYLPWLMPGTFNLNCGNATLTALGPGQFILMSGDLNTIIDAHGSGDLFRWVHTGAISDGTTTGGGLIGGGTIDGTSCSGAAIAIHAGDINALRFDFRAQHFNQTGGSWGLLMDNQNQFTERAQLNVRFKDCGFAPGDGGHIGFNVGGASTSTGSFARLKARIEITEGTNQQDGLVLNNGAHIYDYDMELVGNFTGGASATTAAAWRITGTVPAGHPGAGTHSAMSNGRLTIGLECSTGAHTPIDFVQGATSNSVTDTYGNINWNTNFTSSGITGAGFKFMGLVQGDAAMGTRLYYGTSAAQTLTGNGQTIQSTVPSAKIPVSATGAVTGTIQSAGDVDGQTIYVINTGANLITYDVAGTSNVAAGASMHIAAGEGKTFIWDAGSALWYGKT